MKKTRNYRPLICLFVIFGTLGGVMLLNKLTTGPEIEPFLKWDETPTDQSFDFRTSFSYDLNAFSSGKIEDYSIDDTYHFIIYEDGLIVNRTNLPLGEYNLTIIVEDSNGLNLTEDIIVKSTYFIRYNDTVSFDYKLWVADVPYEVGVTDNNTDPYQDKSFNSPISYDSLIDGYVDGVIGIELGKTKWFETAWDEGYDTGDNAFKKLLYWVKVTLITPA